MKKLGRPLKSGRRNEPVIHTDSVDITDRIDFSALVAPSMRFVDGNIYFTMIVPDEFADRVLPLRRVGAQLLDVTIGPSVAFAANLAGARAELGLD